MTLVYPGSDQLRLSKDNPPGSKPLRRPPPKVKATRLAYLIWDVADMEEQEQFLQDFGMLTHFKDEESLYMRSYSNSPYLYIGRKARQTKFVGLGFEVASRNDLETLSQECDVPLISLQRPGGGEVVVLTAPDSIRVEVCFGIDPVEAIDAEVYFQPSNSPSKISRINAGIRPPLRPSPVMNLGHCVLATNNFERAANWYMEHLGLIPTDVVCLDDATPVITFMRLDRGDTPADHHTIVLSKGTGVGYEHSAYEVQDLDALAQGQQFLKMKSYTHLWGLGRHILGSQLFDYWHDPSGYEFEHYTDGDVFTADYETGYHPLDTGNIYAWGQDMPKSFVQPGLVQIMRIIKALLTGELSLNWLKQVGKATKRPPRPWL